jgi:hypothetical protein
MEKGAKMRVIHAVLLAGLCFGPAAAFAQSAAATAEMRALREAESGLREVLLRMERGGVPAADLQRALRDVQAAMAGLPATTRRGPNWDTAQREMSEAMAAAGDRGVSAEAARQAAGEALATLPALRGEETGSGGT